MESTPNHAHTGMVASASPRPTSQAMITGSLRARSTSTPAKSPKIG